MTARRDLLRVTADDPDYRRLAAAEAEYWSGPVPFALEALEERFSEGPVDRYTNERFTGDPAVGWERAIARRGPFRRGLVLGLSALRVEGEILATNPGLHLTFMDLSAGSLARRADVLGARFPGRVATVCADLNFVELEPDAYDLIASSASLHHVTNLEHLAWQINAALRPKKGVLLPERLRRRAALPVRGREATGLRAGARPRGGAHAGQTPRLLLDGRQRPEPVLRRAVGRGAPRDAGPPSTRWRSGPPPRSPSP